MSNFKNSHFSDVQQLANGTLIIESVEPRHSGKYICRHREDSISYELKVQAVSNGEWNSFSFLESPISTSLND